MSALLTIDPGPGSAFEVLLEPQPRRTRLGVARGEGPFAGKTAMAAAWLVVEGGEGRLRAGAAAADVGGRSDVFEGPGWSAFVPPGTELAVEGAIRYTLVWRSSDRGGDGRVIAPHEVAEEQRGVGASARTVRTYLPEGALIAGETVNPPGGWSSWPPHRHEHEEVYLYRFDPAQGFGIAMSYGDATEVVRVVREGQVQRIASGYHPVASAPGYSMYYLWALAGDSDVLMPSLDPVHAWTDKGVGQ